jgi:hypothetical protein
MPRLFGLECVTVIRDFITAHPFVWTKTLFVWTKNPSKSSSKSTAQQFQTRRQPRSLETDAVFLGILEVIEVGSTFEVDLTRLAGRELAAIIPDDVDRGEGLAYGTGVASHSSEQIVLPAKPSVPQ